jgi:hypothetical protein
LRTISAPNFASLKLVLADEVERLRSDDPLRPIVVITPGDLGRETVRRSLGAGGGTLGVSVRSLNDWITELTSDEIERRRGHRLREPAFERLVAKVVERRLRRARRSGPLAAAAETSGFSRAMASSLADLAIARLDATTLASAPRRDAIRRELIETFTEVAHEADASAYFDRRAEEALAAERLRTTTTAAPLVFFGFHDLTALQREIVQSADGVTAVVMLVPGPGDTGDTATAPLVDWARLHGEFEAR